jgi:hypothetical protein
MKIPVAAAALFYSKIAAAIAKGLLTFSVSCAERQQNSSDGPLSLRREMWKNGTNFSSR